VEQLVRELEAWAEAGLAARFWWRDDDATSDTEQLRQFLTIAKNFGIVPGVAVIPERADASLVARASRADATIWQHGWGHHFHELGEFGEGRPLPTMSREALLGQRRLDDLFGDSGWQRVFVPPNHMISMSFKAALPRLGYFGLSAGLPLTPRLDDVREFNAEVDVMHWREGRVLPVSTVCEMLCEQLRTRREGARPVNDPIGVLTHHSVFDDEGWEVVSTILEVLTGHRAVDWLRADRLFEVNPESPDMSCGNSRPVEHHTSATRGVTVVITSCGRPDLLVRTLDSFIEHNTYPIADFILMEDGEKPASPSLEDRYRARNFKWLFTGARLGQMRTIDRAYALVNTEYIFHCEDDWEFLASGFIEKSLAVLEHSPNTLQVWLRAADDTNGHPIMREAFTAGDVAYRLMQPGYVTPEWGTWHGFSLNPGLRRHRDYLLLGSFAHLDPHRDKPPYEVEREASEFYMKRGFLAAILTDQAGRGYVRHIGWGRRVGEYVSPPTEGAGRSSHRQ
jgi:hypothetical protein